MPDAEPTDLPPIVFSIPDATLAQLRARRAERKPATTPKPNRPILTTVEMMVHAGDYDPIEVANAFCDDMSRLQVEIEEEYDAFLMDPGMGPMIYLTSDGRILSDHRTWDGEGIQFETILDHAISFLVAGAKMTGIESLLDLIPPLANSVQCEICQGTRWFTCGKHQLVCPACFGRGQRLPE